MNKKKILALCLIVCLLSVAVVGGTLAYFTDTDDATNTFTMGKVDIDLDEPNYAPSEDGKLKVFPGQTYAKDPTITVAADSEDCWLVATVTVDKRACFYGLYENDTTGVKQPWGLSLAGNGKLVSGGIAGYDAAPATMGGMSGTMLGDSVFLTYSEDVAADTITYTYYFLTVHTANQQEVLFTAVNIPSIIDNGDFDSDIELDVKAYAIQAVGFSNVFDAYAAQLAQGD